MNRTELFRDFLIKECIKKKFEEKYRLNQNSKAFRRKYPLKWTDDFLTNLMKSLKYPERELFKFLSPMSIITWRQDGDHEWEFWNKTNIKWNTFYNKNEYLIDK